MVAASLLPLGALAAQAVPVPVPKPDVTSVLEARRSAGVLTSKLAWYSCYYTAECATVRLPLDYDLPLGAKTEIALVRIKAHNPKARIGSLFVNPGGPGGSGVGIALGAPYFLDQGLLDRFDIVGFDPRGTNYSDNVKCFTSNAAQHAGLGGMSVPFPDTTAQEAAFVASSRVLGRACSTTGSPLAGSMSTAEVARDMDVLRRAVGDTRLSYLGFSYGTYLGQVYANMYPDRVRAMAIDGVLDPVAWAGATATATIPQTTRIKSGEGAAKALNEILVRCDQAGLAKCRFAAGDPVANFALVAQRLRIKPLRSSFLFGNFGYADLVANTLGSLFGPFGYLDISDNLTELMIATSPAVAGASPSAAKAAAARRLVAIKALAKNLAAQKARSGRSARPGFNFPYENSFEAFNSVLCTDGLNPQDAASWPAAGKAADLKAKYFGKLWTWESSGCASLTWTARDEDAYRGTFTHRTVSPILVVGTVWDPATNYAGAARAASLLPNSRLLPNDNWGHTSYGSSYCASSAIDNYLLTLALPPVATFCHGDLQPFEDSPDGLRAAAVRHRPLPPVVSPLVTAAG